jgi:hypothetical protein
MLEVEDVRAQESQMQMCKLLQFLNNYDNSLTILLFLSTLPRGTKETNEWLSLLRVPRLLMGFRKCRRDGKPSIFLL